MPKLLPSLRPRLFLAVVFLVLATACTAPRSVIHSGKVTPHGQFKVGFNAGGNLASEPIGELKNITEAAVDALLKQDSVYYGPQIQAATRGAIAYSLDPVGPTFDFYVRYGVLPRVDVGYKYAGGVHVVDAMYQFMGSVGTLTNPGSQRRWSGSVGVQYSGQDSDLLDKLFLSKLSPILEFTATRKDVLVPLVFSRSFGVEEEYGNISFGVAYNHTFIEYGLQPTKLYRKVGGNEVVRLDGLTKSNSFGSFGLFVNAKIGAKRIYLLPALAMYYQNYGTYDLLLGEQYSYAGFTLVPSLGVQIGLGKGKVGRK
ncbi:hypothetical protein [Rufibacter sp. LB8]|uniref:hypothetical protein n=1 Tax=Rufibacter sp. LB8 TaxID=2777781 RepID=UPI00178C2099|nr:hypothetical protein [Rufibacter sp. LB8]